MKSWYQIICEALLATQLTRRGRWRSAVKLMNPNTQHGVKHESF
jgi:hypothetical protein